LTAQTFSSSQIDLAWTDNSDNESGFKIERCQGAGCSNFAPLAQVGTDVVSYGDTGLTGNTTYRYRVYAFNAGGDSGYSNEAEATTQAASLMHIGDLDGASSKVNRTKWKATVVIAVHDSVDAALSGAIVSGTWSGGYSGTGSCTTDASGTCSVSTANVANNKANVTFTVSNVTKSGYSYNPAANHDVDGGTNGTSITVAKP
jgi:hypothetical protein